MISCTRIYEVAYYLASAEQQAADRAPIPMPEAAGRDRPNAEPCDGPGRWVVLQPEPPAALLLRPGVPNILDGLRPGDPVVPGVLRDLVAGRDPATGRMAARRRRPIAGAPVPPSGGYDLQFSLPKSVSLLGLVGELARPGLLAAIRAIHAQAISRALQWAFDLGLVASRSRGRHVPVQRVIGARFDHAASRAGDPQLHSHVVLCKTAVGRDGRLRQLDNYLLLTHAGAIAALARCEEVFLLQERLGLRTRPVGRSYEIIGVPAPLLALFSKRRRAITARMAAAGRGTAQDRRAAQLAAYATRPGKTHGALRDAQAAWAAEAAAQGWSAEALLRSVAQAQAARPPLQETDATARAAELLRLCADHPPQNHAASDGFTAAFELLQHEAIGSDAVLDLVAACSQAPAEPRPVVPAGGQAAPGIAALANAVREAGDERPGGEAVPPILPEPGF
ncbi:relaxase domain-containing protein [Limimaricola sp. G21655-S1]|uniref:MobF family relaxase n=1 Tax=Limimaricola sp. G21655-S1 TaxID=3014768 RepID=UPI0022AF0758|nr:MobF family relaxase [Limimaricola sp. G21655-S1]MCZ4260869.1 relaxase domain-containing protein [Limimaricola sp. G21655-S1]